MNESMKATIREAIKEAVNAMVAEEAEKAKRRLENRMNEAKHRIAARIVEQIEFREYRNQEGEYVIAVNVAGIGRKVDHEPN